MSVKKSLAAAGAATTLAIAGTGVASAQDTPDTPPTQGSADASAERDVFGSITGADALGSWTDGQIDYGKTLIALASIAGGAASVAAIAGAYDAVVGASDTWQGVVSDTIGFLESQGVL
ncbi:MAG: hypothetical protein ACTH1D_11635 [Mycobacteriaceae bacterium]|uniref:hypothetical protein n=1 Tax=Corynebacterium sp. TaxID=1720 RepID=UPI003F9A8A3B